MASTARAGAQSAPPASAPAAERPRSYDRQFEVLEKKIDDLEWRARTEDIAVMDKWWITSPKPARTTNPTGQGAGNPLKIPVYSFVPKSLGARKGPMLILIPLHELWNTLRQRSDRNG